MNTNMKRPPSVVATRIIFGLFILLGIFALVSNSAGEVSELIAGLAMPFLFLVGWVGVFLRKKWARLYSAALIILFALLMLALPFINKAEQKQQIELIFVLVIMDILLIWWAYSLSLGSASKDYFLSNENT